MMAVVWVYCSAMLTNVEKSNILFTWMHDMEMEVQTASTRNSYSLGTQIVVKKNLSRIIKSHALSWIPIICKFYALHRTYKHSWYICHSFHTSSGIAIVPSGRISNWSVLKYCVRASPNQIKSSRHDSAWIQLFCLLWSDVAFL